MKREYDSIMKGLNLRTKPLGVNDHILLIDGLNTLIRSFSTIQSMNPKGHHIGGLVGFLRSLGYLIRIIEPTRVVCIFDGKGSTVNRKYIDPQYKAQRKLKRITNWDLFDDRVQEAESLSAQLVRLYDYLECLPVQVLEVDKVEADDVIATIAKTASNSNKKVTIVSTDMDFLQLINKNINVYSPKKKVKYTVDNVQEQIQVLPENYSIVKALTKDVSDNLQGVKGLGIKTILKEFEGMATDPEYTLDKIYEVSKEKLGTKIIFAKIIDSWDKVETNFQLMDLKKETLGEREVEVIYDTLKTPKLDLQIGGFLHLLEVDDIEGITKNTEGWLEIFRSLTTFKK